MRWLNNNVVDVVVGVAVVGVVDDLAAIVVIVAATAIATIAALIVTRFRVLGIIQ